MHHPTRFCFYEKPNHKLFEYYPLKLMVYNMEIVLLIPSMGEATELK